MLRNMCRLKNYVCMKCRNVLIHTKNCGWRCNTATQQQTKEAIVHAYSMHMYLRQHDGDTVTQVSVLVFGGGVSLYTSKYIDRIHGNARVAFGDLTTLGAAFKKCIRAPEMPVLCG